MPRFSANLGFLWPDRPLLDRIDAAAAAGFRAVELHWPYDTPAAEVRARCDARRVTLLGVNTSRGREGESGLGALPGREAEFAAAVDQAIAFCVAAGGSAIHCMAGVIGDADPAAARDTFVANLRDASRAAEPHGLTLLLEPLNPRDAPGYFYSTVAEGAAVIEAVGAPNLRLMFDCYHVASVGQDVGATLRRFLPLVGHIQFASVPDRAEPDSGTPDYPDVFRAIDALGYAGWVGAEYRPRAATDDGLGWLAAAEAAAPAVSLMITRRQKERLRELGFTEDAIREMRPAEAHAHLGL